MLRESNDNGRLKISIPAHQIGKLHESNYHPWSTTVREIIWESRRFFIVDGTETPLNYRRRMWTTLRRQLRMQKTLKILNQANESLYDLLATISAWLIAYVDDVNDSGQIWKILRGKYRPLTQVTPVQALKEMQGPRMMEGGDIDVHLHSFRLAKRRVEEHGISFISTSIRLLSLSLSLPDSDNAVFSIIEHKSFVAYQKIGIEILEPIVYSLTFWGTKAYYNLVARKFTQDKSGCNPRRCILYTQPAQDGEFILRFCIFPVSPRQWRCSSEWSATPWKDLLLVLYRTK